MARMWWLCLVALLPSCGAPRANTVVPHAPRAAGTPPATESKPTAATAATPTPAKCGDGALREPRGGKHVARIVVDGTKATNEQTKLEIPKTLLASRDGSRLLALRSDGEAFVWDARENRLLAQLEARPKRVLDAEGGEFMPEELAFGDDGARVLGISWAHGDHGWEIRGTERVWDAKTGKRLSVRTFTASGYKMERTPDLARRAIWTNGYFTDSGGQIAVGGIPASAALAIGAKKGWLFFEAAWSEDGSRIAVTRGRDIADPTGDNPPRPSQLALWELSSASPRGRLVFDRALDDAGALGFTANGALLVVTGGEHAMVLDAATGGTISTLEGVGALLPSARRDIVALQSRFAPGAPALGREVMIFDAASGARRRVIQIPVEAGGNGEPVAALRPDGASAAIANGVRLCLVGVDDGKLTTDVAWSADPRWSTDGASVQGVISSDDEASVSTLRLADESVEEVVVRFVKR